MFLDRESWLGRRDTNLETLRPLASTDELKGEIELLRMGAEFLKASPQEMSPQVHSIFTSRLGRVIDSLQGLPTSRVDVTRVEDLEIDLESGLVSQAGSILQLSPIERRLLLTLGSKPGRVFSHEELLREAWLTDDLGSMKSLNVCMSNLRKKLGDTNPEQRRYIETAFGWGYSLVGIRTTTEVGVPRENLTLLQRVAEGLVPEPHPNNTALMETVAGQLKEIALVFYQARLEVKSGKLSVGHLEIDLGKLRVTKKGAEISLTPKELQMLILLAKHANKPVSSLTLLRSIWGEEYGPPELHYIRVYINNIRKKIEDSPQNPQQIKTFQGLGYMLTGEVGQEQARVLEKAESPGLTPTESLIYRFLSEREGEIVSTDEIARVAQIGVDTYGWPAPHLVNSYIGALRKKLKEGMQIEYVKGRGYRLTTLSAFSTKTANP